MHGRNNRLAQSIDATMRAMAIVMDTLVTRIIDRTPAATWPSEERVTDILSLRAGMKACDISIAGATTAAPATTADTSRAHKSDVLGPILRATASPTARDHPAASNADRTVHRISGKPTIQGGPTVIRALTSPRGAATATSISVHRRAVMTTSVDRPVATTIDRILRASTTNGTSDRVADLVAVTPPLKSQNCSASSTSLRGNLQRCSASCGRTN